MQSMSILYFIDMLVHNLTRDVSFGYFDGHLLNVSVAMTGQSVFKHILTEGDKVSLSRYWWIVHQVMIVFSLSFRDSAHCKIRVDLQLPTTTVSAIPDGKILMLTSCASHLRLSCGTSFSTASWRIITYILLPGVRYRWQTHGSKGIWAIVFHFTVIFSFHCRAGQSWAILRADYPRYFAPAKVSSVFVWYACRAERYLR